MAGVSISSGVSLSRTAGAGTSGITAGTWVKSGEAGIMKGGAVSIVVLESGEVGKFVNMAFGAEILGSGDLSPKSEVTGMSGAVPGMSELGVSKMGSVVIFNESLFNDFFKLRKPIFFDAVALGGGVAGTSSAVLTFGGAGSFLSFFGFRYDESPSSLSLLPLVLSLPNFSFPSLLSFPLEVAWIRGFLLSFISFLKTTLGARFVFPSMLWLMEVSREGRAPAGR